MRRAAVIVIFTLFTLGGLVSAGDSGRTGPGNKIQENGMKGASAYCWEGKRIVQAIFLTDEEKETLSETRDKNLSEIQDLKKILKKQRLALEKILDRNDLSVSEAQRKFKKTEETLAKIHKKRFELQLQERKLLGPERFARLQEMEKQGQQY